MGKLSYDKTKKRYRVSYYDARGRRTRRFFLLKENAKDFLRHVENREERLKRGLGFIDAVSFEDAVEGYKEEYLRLKSPSHCLKTWRRLIFLKDHFEGKPLCDITELDINRLIRARKDEGLSHKTINEDRSAIRGLLSWACKRGLAAENPVDQVDALPKLPRTIRRAFTHDEVNRLLLHACECCRPALAILANTGIRLGELDYLTTENFDLGKQLLTIKHSEQTPVKGKRSRVVPLNDTLLRLLESLPEGKILRMPRSTFEKHFHRIRTRAKVLDAHPHGLRHTFVSHMVEAGVDLGKIQRITGHQDIKTLQKYLHSTGTDLQPIRNAVEFAVPKWCPKSEIVRTKWGEVRLHALIEEFPEGMKKPDLMSFLTKSGKSKKVEVAGIELRL